MKKISIYDDEGPIAISAILEYEKIIGYTFPSYYKELLSKHNVLWLEERHFDFSSKNHKDTRDVTFLGFGTEISRSEQISRAQQTEYCHDHILVIGVAANGDYICFDYRADPATDNPPVVLMFHDDYDENDKMIICPVADNFEDFIASLYTWDEDDQ